MITKMNGNHGNVQLNATVRSNMLGPDMTPKATTISGTGCDDHKWYQKSWPEVVPEVMTGSNTRGDDRKRYRKWYRKSWPEVVPEVMTGSGTESHDRKWYRMSWPESIGSHGKFSLAPQMLLGLRNFTNANFLKLDYDSQQYVNFHVNHSSSFDIHGRTNPDPQIDR